MKKVLLIITAIIALGAITYGGFYLLAKHIFGRTDCERFNIDNVELRTGIGIPPVLSSECDCDTEKMIKRTSFIIDTAKTSAQEYIDRGRFQLVNDQYVASGDNKNTKWNAVFDKETAKIDFVIEYKVDN